MLTTKFVEKIKARIVCSVTPHPQSKPRPHSEKRAVYEIMWKKYCTARLATDENIIRRMRFACCLSLQTHIRSTQYLLHFKGNNVNAYTPRCYVVLTLPVLLQPTLRVFTARYDYKLIEYRFFLFFLIL